MSSPVSDIDLHAHLIGQQGGRRALNTPVLVVDIDVLARNIQSMAAFAAEHGLALRPHAKTHKSADIARMQIAAGAVGVCSAKLGEAEAMANGEVDSILITSPVVTAPGIERLIALNQRIGDLRVVTDNPTNVQALMNAATTEKPLQVLVDIDPGIRRTGVASPEAALALAKQIAAAPSLRFLGVQYYCGREQHIEAWADRVDAMKKRTAYLKGIVDQLNAAGLSPQVITGGGTGTHRIDADLGVLNELQTGSYVFMDRQYNDCDLTGDGVTPFETSLFVDARVVSANTPGMATIDAGFKAMATDGGPPTILSGAPEGAVYHFMGDEHGAIVAADATFAIGDAVTLAVPHCDPTVNLYDHYHVVSHDTLVRIWPVQARGRSR
ncbi:MAG: DSD1 family PLP-dependent enzyme [Alphaproteobacteria bacterium]|nr:DSD1 family PLP-dependent enzyme [Alphaproteobacteria bacterium]